MSYDFVNNYFLIGAYLIECWYNCKICSNTHMFIDLLTCRIKWLPKILYLYLK